MRLRAAALASLLLVAGPAQAEPPVWVVRDTDSEMLLCLERRWLHIQPYGCVCVRARLRVFA